MGFIKEFKDFAMKGNLVGHCRCFCNGRRFRQSGFIIYRRCGSFNWDDRWCGFKKQNVLTKEKSC